MFTVAVRIGANAAPLHKWLVTLLIMIPITLNAAHRLVFRRRLPRLFECRTNVLHESFSSMTAAMV